MIDKIPSDIVRLQDMLNAIGDAKEMAVGSLQERKDVFATAYAVAIVGEAAGHLSSELIAANSHIPWREITGMRHKIIHGYGKVNVQLLLGVVREHLPILETQLTEILQKLQSDNL